MTFQSDLLLLEM